MCCLLVLKDVPDGSEELIDDDDDDEDRQVEQCSQMQLFSEINRQWHQGGLEPTPGVTGAGQPSGLAGPSQQT